MRNAEAIERIHRDGARTGGVSVSENETNLRETPERQPENRYEGTSVRGRGG